MAAARLLEELPSEDALSLRAVAREVGVSAPSVYLHFEDKDAIVVEVMRRRFAALAESLDAAGAGCNDPRAELAARSVAYCEFGARHPGAYRAMFSSVPNPRENPADLPGPAMVGVMARLIAQCGVSDGFAAATTLWCGLHGIVTLRQTKPAFPWGAQTADIERLLEAVLSAPC